MIASSAMDGYRKNCSRSLSKRLSVQASWPSFDIELARNVIMVKAPILARENVWTLNDL